LSSQRRSNEQQKAQADHPRKSTGNFIYEGQNHG
jgi:hypothetical protein